jgi:hypothetical protein
MIQEMEKLQAKGEVGEDEMRALEMDVTGRVSASIQIIWTLVPRYSLPDHAGIMAGHKI